MLIEIVYPQGRSGDKQLFLLFLPCSLVNAVTGVVQVTGVMSL